MAKDPLSEEEKRNWLSEHLPYELKMARYSHKQLTRGELNYLDFNSYLVSFAVSASNVYAFLTNKERQNNNVQACDFVVGGFAAKSERVKTIFAEMDPEFF